MKKFNKNPIKQNFKKERNKRSLTKAVCRVSSKRMILKPNNSDIKARQIKVLDKKENIGKKVKEFDEFVQEFLNSKKISDNGALNSKKHKLLIFNYDKGFFSENLKNKNKEQNFS